MTRLAFALSLAAAGAFVLVTSGALPERVASHFGAGGAADGYMTRDGYRVFMLAFAVGMPLMMVALIGGLPRLFPRHINIPNREYWLAPERREKTLGALTRHAMWLGIVMAVLIAGVHALLLEANRAAPPRLATAPFVALLIGFLVAMAVWIAVLYRQFRRPGGA